MKRFVFTVSVVVVVVRVSSNKETLYPVRKGPSETPFTKVEMG